MNRATKMFSSGLIAAAAVAALPATKSYGALVLSYATNPGGQATINGVSYDVIDVNLAGLTLADTQTGVTGGDPGILGLSGTFSVVQAGGVLGVPGDSTATSKGFYGKYLTNGTAIQLNNAIGNTSSSSYVNMDSMVSSATVRVGTGTSNGSATVKPTNITGTSTSLTGTWYVSPGNAEVEPASGIAPNPLLAEFLITPGDSLAFTGAYSTQGSTAAPLAFTSGGTTTPPPPTHSIVSLTGAAPTGYGSALPTIVLQKYNGQIIAGYDVLPTPNATAYQPVTGFATTDAPEVYALKLLVGGQTPTAAQLQTIITDINSASSTDGVVATLVQPAYASVFPGYSIQLTDAAGGFSTPSLGFDFSAESNVAGVTVSAVAAVPEPATVGGLLVGAGSLLLGRRKNRAA